MKIVVAAHGIQAAVRSFNECVPPGTVVEWHGKHFRTWSPGAMDWRRRAVVVFLEHGPDEPVNAAELTIPNVCMVDRQGREV